MNTIKDMNTINTCGVCMFPDQEGERVNDSFVLCLPCAEFIAATDGDIESIKGFIKDTTVIHNT